MICANPHPATVASGDGDDKSDVCPLHSLSTRSRAQALNERVKGECVCVCVSCVRVRARARVGGGGVLVACCLVSLHVYLYTCPDDFCQSPSCSCCQWRWR